MADFTIADVTDAMMDGAVLARCGGGAERAVRAVQDTSPASQPHTGKKLERPAMPCTRVLQQMFLDCT